MNHGCPSSEEERGAHGCGGDNGDDSGVLKSELSVSLNLNLMPRL